MSTYKQYTIKNTVYFISIYPQKQNFEESPVDILLKEFAKGAITEEEYLAKRKYM